MSNRNFPNRYLSGFRANSAGDVIIASFDKGGTWLVHYRTRWNEDRYIRGLKRIDASIQVSALKARGYRATMKQEN
jgi:hypothetical protein